MLRSDLEKLKDRIRSGEIDSWPEVHLGYKEIGASYEENRRKHARKVLEEFTGRSAEVNRKEALETAAFILEGIQESRKKDYLNHFRNITFENNEERDAVVGSFEENEFIIEAEKELERITRLIQNSSSLNG